MTKAGPVIRAPSLVQRKTFSKGSCAETRGNLFAVFRDFAAIRAIPPGGKVLKYGAIIGSATNAIAQGEHIHTQNLVSDYITSYHH